MDADIFNQLLASGGNPTATSNDQTPMQQPAPMPVQQFEATPPQYPPQHYQPVQHFEQPPQQYPPPQQYQIPDQYQYQPPPPSAPQHYEQPQQIQAPQQYQPSLQNAPLMQPQYPQPMGPQQQFQTPSSPPVQQYQQQAFVPTPPPVQEVLIGSAKAAPSFVVPSPSKSIDWPASSEKPKDKESLKSLQKRHLALLDQYETLRGRYDPTEIEQLKEEYRDATVMLESMGGDVRAEVEKGIRNYERKIERLQAQHTAGLGMGMETGMGGGLPMFGGRRALPYPILQRGYVPMRRRGPWSWF